MTVSANSALHAFRRLGANVTGLVVQNAFQLLLSFWLVRTLSHGEYGIYALAFTLISYGNAFQNAGVIAPLSAQVGRLKGSGRERQFLVFTSGGSMILAAMLLVSAAVFTRTSGDWLHAGWAFALLVGATMARYHTRNELVLRRQSARVVRDDVIYVAIGCLAVLPAILAPGRDWTLPLAMAGVAVANGASAMLRGSLKGVRLMVRRWRALARRYLAFRHEVGWQLVSVAAAMAIATPQAIVVYALYTPDRFAPIAAAALIFGPLRVLSAAALATMRAEFAQMLAVNALASIKKILALWAAAVGAITVAGAGAIWVVWPLLSRHLYTSYDPQQIVFCLILLGLTTSSAFMRGMTAALVTAARRYVTSAKRNLMIAPVVLGVAFAFGFAGRPIDSLWALVLAEVLLLISDSQLIRQELSWRAKNPEGPPDQPKAAE